MRNSVGTVLALLLLSLTVRTALADDAANTNRGFSPDGAFQVGDVDSVNLFNGNVIVNIPIEPSYALRGGGSYAVHLVYTGIPWDFVGTQDNNTGVIYYSVFPNRRSNAGLGWRVTMGRLVLPGDPTYKSATGLPEYESPDGAIHNFYPTLHPSDSPVSNVSYTRDDTYLRMTYLSAVPAYDVAFPDGTIQRFDASTGNLLQIRTQYDTDTSPSLTVNYHINDTALHDQDGAAVFGWELSDAFGRSNWVTFTSDSHVSGAGRLFSKIILKAPGGRTVTYAAEYNNGSSVDSYITPDPGSCNAYQLDTGTPTTIQYPLLTAIDLPDGSKYQMAQFTNGNQCSSGSLQTLTLPTGGYVNYAYQDYLIGAISGGGGPKHPDEVPYTPGVQTRTKYNGDGTSVGQWTYATVGNDASGKCINDQYNGELRELQVTVTNPNGDRSINYFSVSRHVVSCTQDNNSEGWQPSEYGLPLTHRFKFQPGDGQTYLLSQQVIPSGGTSSVRDTYVTYESDGTLFDLSRTSDSNRRQFAGAAVYVDDGSKYSTVFRSSFDGLGHYRQAVTGGTSGFATNVTTYTDYNAVTGTYGQPGWSMLPAGSTWLLNVFDYADTTQSGLTARTEACFDANGFMTRSRRLTNGTTESGNDLLAAFTNESISNRVASESYYGGDSVSWVQCASGVQCQAQTPGYASRSVPTGNICGVTLPASAQYSIVHQYDHGVLQSSQYYNGGVGMPFFSVNRTIDASGLVSSSTDASGVSTTYNYDPAMPTRILSIVTPSTKTKFAFVNASGSGLSFAPATVTETRTDPGETQPGVSSTYQYDGFGRMVQASRDMPAGFTAISATTYDALNRKSSVSQWESTPTHFTTFAYDAFGRQTQATAPDGSVITTVYTGASQIARHVNVFTGGVQQDTVTTEQYDDRGRLTSVTEPNGTLTKYSYDVGDRLNGVCMGWVSDPCTGQQRTFTYDGRGLLASERHPETGSFTYAYDARGHVMTKRHTDGAGNPDGSADLVFFYDPAERLLEVGGCVPSASDPTKCSISGSSETFRIFKSFNFDVADASNLGKGKLASATRYNYLPAGTYVVTEAYKYNDPDGRLYEKDTTITDPQSNSKTLTQTWSYDWLNNPTSVSYPACASGCGTPAWASVTNTYDRGYVSSMNTTGDPSPVARLQYSLGGMITQVSHENGMFDTYNIDTSTNMQRPRSITFSPFSACTSPTIVTQPQSQSVASGTSVTLSVNAGGTSPWTYQWYDAPTSQPLSGQTGSTLTVTVTGTQSYFVVVTSPCGRIQSSTATLSTCSPPSITSQPASTTIAAGQTATLSVTASGAALTYQWYQGTAPDTSTPVGSGAATYTTAALSTTTSYWVRVTGCGGSVNSSTATVTVQSLPAPTSLVATATAMDVAHNTATITITWNGSAGSTYAVFRKDHGSAFNPVGGNTTATTLTDTVAMNATYVYHVETTLNGAYSAPSNDDMATPMVFTQITPNVTPVTVATFNEVLTAINSVRTAAGIATVTWSGILQGTGLPVPSNNPPVAISGGHVMALRQQMDYARGQLGFSPGVYTDATLPGSPPAQIKRVHITELENLTQ